MRQARRTKLVTALAVGAAGLLLTLPGQALAGPDGDAAADRRGQERAAADPVPLSAVENITRTEVQADGSLTTTRERNHLYRDGAGRTRHESGSTVTITDPVAGTTAVLDTEKREYTRSAAPTDEAGRGADAPEQDAQAPQAQQRDISSEPRNLGTATIAGVEATGASYTVSHPSMKGEGTIDKEVTIWLSTEAQLDVRMRVTEESGAVYDKKYTDVAVGKEPSASLFKVPAGYERVTPGASPLQQDLECPLTVSPDPLVLTNSYSYPVWVYGYQSGYTGNGCGIVDTAAVFESPLRPQPATEYLGLPYFDWLWYDDLGVPFFGNVAFGSTGFLAYSSEDTTEAWGLVVLYLF